MRVFDVGCGQGRDALFVAQQGHAVTGVVADIEAFTPAGMFDVILFDRPLHMLTSDAGAAVLARLLGYVSASGWVLIADEPANIAGFAAVLAADSRAWRENYRKRGYLFVEQT